MKKLFLSIVFLGIAGTLIAQDADSISTVAQNVEFLYQLLLEQTEDRLSETLELGEGHIEESHEDLIEDYLFYLEHPINVNSEDVVHLEEIGLLSVFQLEALQRYRRQFGDLQFADELLMLEEFSDATVVVITPLVFFGKSEKTKELDQPGLGTMFTRGRHQITMNYAEKFDGTTNDDYLGSPRKLQLKYAYHFKQKLRFGFVMEKDAGEPFFFGGLNDSIRDIVRRYRHQGFDFYGAYGHVSDIRITDAMTVKDLTLGDYQLSFGQGLTLWSGMSFGKASNGSSPIKRAAGIRPKTSSGEGKFFRGVATTLKYRDFYATAFYSTRRVDATISLADSLDEPELISALQETGYHRTINELAKRNTVSQQVFGGHFCYAGSNLEIGYTLFHLRLSAPLELKPLKYNQYYFHGDRLTDMGLDFRWLLNNIVVFGELARSNNGAMAGLIGMTIKPRGYIDFSLLYRNYAKDYQNLLSGAFGESSRGQGEEGVYLGLQCAPAPGWDLLAYCDFFRLTWLTSQVYNPSWGQECNIKVIHNISGTATMQLRFKSKTKMKNSVDDHVFSYYPVFYTKHSLNFQLTYGITESLTFSDKAAYSHYFNDDGINGRGYLLCHDIVYKPPNRPFAITFRYALFSSDDYNSRVSVYENDVLGAFSIPSLSGAGQRAYLLGKLKLFNSLNIYSRVGLTVSDGEAKTDLKVEVIWKG